MLALGAAGPPRGTPEHPRDRPCGLGDHDEDHPASRPLFEGRLVTGPSGEDSHRWRGPADSVGTPASQDPLSAGVVDSTGAAGCAHQCRPIPVADGRRHRRRLADPPHARTPVLPPRGEEPRSVSAANPAADGFLVRARGTEVELVSRLQQVRRAAAAATGVAVAADLVVDGRAEAVGGAGEGAQGRPACPGDAAGQRTITRTPSRPGTAGPDGSQCDGACGSLWCRVSDSVALIGLVGSDARSRRRSGPGAWGPTASPG